MGELVALTMVLTASLSPERVAAQRRSAPPRIAIVADGPSDGATRVTALLATEVTALFEGAYPGIAVPTAPTHGGDFTQERAEALVSEVLEDDAIDLVVALGILGGNAIAR